MEFVICRLARTLLLTGAVFLAGCSGPAVVPAQTPLSQPLVNYYQQWQGVRYRWGGVDKRGVDCSAFTRNLYQELYNTSLPRMTGHQARAGYEVDLPALRPGDLVFFKTGWRTRHVGVYIGADQFIHAAESRGVTRSSLYSPYWQSRFWQARRAAVHN